MLAPAALAEHEKAAIAALDRLKKLKNLKRGDWRLVAAAQAMRSKMYADEFDAAAAMGKVIKQRREVNNWSDKLEELEQLNQAKSTLLDDSTRSALLVKAEWIEQKLPGVKQVHADALVLSANKRHGKRSISAVATTPGGTTHPTSAIVDYTLPPSQGERESAAKRRAGRHHHREQRQLRALDLSGADDEHRAMKAKQRQNSRAESANVFFEVEHAVISMVARVEQLNGWVEDHGFHWLPLSPLQLLAWPSVFGYAGSHGMPLCNGAWAWLVDSENAEPPQLAQVNRWFNNGFVELHLLHYDLYADTHSVRCVKPTPGVLLPLDERRPRYVGEKVRLWGKRSCAAIRGTADDVEARAASATTCPDYRPLTDSFDFAPAYCINKQMYTFDELGYVGNAYDCETNQICADSLERADSILEGRSQLAIVTAVHPSDKFVISSKAWHAPRKFFMQARSGETGAHFRLGKSKVTEDVRWVIGSVDLVLFDARTATFTGPALDRVPLFLVNGLGRTASLFEAKLVAQAEIFRLFNTDWGNWRLNSELNRIATAPDPEQLVSQLCEWPSTIEREACDEVIEHLLGLQSKAVDEARMQAFVASCFVNQYTPEGKQRATLEHLCGQGRFPDKLPERGVTYSQVVQDYDPDPPFCAQLKRDESGIRRTDYLLW